MHDKVNSISIFIFSFDGIFQPTLRQLPILNDMQIAAIVEFVFSATFWMIQKNKNEIIKKTKTTTLN